MLRLVFSAATVAVELPPDPAAVRTRFLALLSERATDLEPRQGFEVWCCGNRLVLRSKGAEIPEAGGILVHTFQAHSFYEAVELMRVALDYSGARWEVDRVPVRR